MSVINEFNLCFSLLNEYTEKRDVLLEKAPFHFNILDESKANENAHSKILGRILQYKENGKFVFFEKFLERIDFKLDTQSPEILVEKDRIDISILDKNYAIIIENKIHHAVDQERQIIRYIEKIKEYKRYEFNQIYVLYLTRWGEKVPSENSLPDDIKLALGERYKVISFRQEVLPWLEDVLLNCRQKDTDFVSGMQQYIDHLKGIFNLRTKFNFMNEEIKEFLEDQLSLSDDLGKKSLTIEKKIEDLGSLMVHLQSIREEITYDLRKEFLSRLLILLNDYKKEWQCVNAVKNLKEIKDANLGLFGFQNKKCRYKDSELFFSVEIQHHKKFICGIFCQDETLRTELLMKFKDKEINMDSNGAWIHLNLNEYSYDNIYIAWNVYESAWNKYYISDIDQVVEMFYSEVSKVYEAWEGICKTESIRNP